MPVSRLRRCTPETESVPMLRSRWTFALSRRAVFALTGIAFVALVSIAATHLHIDADADEACAVCAAVAGKLAGPSAASAAKIGVQICIGRAIVPTGRLLALAPTVILPPSRGPPAYS